MSDDEFSRRFDRMFKAVMALAATELAGPMHRMSLYRLNHFDVDTTLQDAYLVGALDSVGLVLINVFDVSDEARQQLHETIADELDRLQTEDEESASAIADLIEGTGPDE